MIYYTAIILEKIESNVEVSQRSFFVSFFLENTNLLSTSRRMSRQEGLLSPFRPVPSPQVHGRGVYVSRPVRAVREVPAAEFHLGGVSAKMKPVEQGLVNVSFCGI